MDRARPNGRGASAKCQARRQQQQRCGGGGGTKPKWNDDEVEQAAVARFDTFMVKLQNQNSLFKESCSTFNKSFCSLTVYRARRQFTLHTQHSASAQALCHRAPIFSERRHSMRVQAYDTRCQRAGRNNKQQAIENKASQWSGAQGEDDSE